MSGLINTEGLSKVYRDGTCAVKDLDLEVNEGEVFGLIGPNGAGKTTTIRMLMGVLKPTAGKIFYEEKQKIIKDQIGYLPEDARFYRFMRVEEYLQWVCKFYPVSDHKNQVASAIQTAGLEELKHRKINSLSKGQNQRVGIAQALVHGPQILILDEPTSGLDPIGKKEILTILQKLSLALVLAILSTFQPPIKYFSPFKYGKAANRALLGAITPGAYLLDLLVLLGFIALSLGIAVFLLTKVEKIS